MSKPETEAGQEEQDLKDDNDPDTENEEGEEGEENDPQTEGEEGEALDPDEERAAVQGWVPKENYRGDPRLWKTAAKFLEVSDKNNAVLKERMDKVSGENINLRSTMERMIKFQEQQQTRAVNRALNEKESERLEAIEAGDAEEVLRIEKEMAEEKASMVPPQPPESKDSPAFQPWKDENNWYDENQEMREFADMIGPGVASRGNFSNDEEVYAAITREVKKHFPQEFGNTNRQKATAVAPVTRKSKPTSGRRFNNLPEDAKQAFKDTKELYSDYTEKEFLEQYEWD